MAAIKMLGYNVQEVNFKFNTDVAQTTGTKNFQISPKIRMDMRQNDKTTLLVCTVTIDKHQPTVTPFELHVVVAGTFVTDPDAKLNLEDIRVETSNMLFPYVRATISQITTATNMPAYYLPFINFADVKPNNGSESSGDAPSSATQSKGNNIVIRPLEEL